MKLTDKMLALKHTNGNSIFSRTPFLAEGTDDCVMTGFTVTISNLLGRSDRINLALIELVRQKEEVLLMFDAIIKTLEDHQSEVKEARNVLPFKRKISS